LVAFLLETTIMKQEEKRMVKHKEVENGLIFPVGEKNEAYAEFFVGQSYLHPLIADPTIDVGVANVTFEPGCRNNWHIHHEGYQLLLVTGGEGWYQEEGKEARRLSAGDVVITHDGVKHWHGAAKDSWFEHIAVTAGTPEWLEPVSDDWYDQLK
jgi:quercetin dioxygenase-like cupin family protein